MSGNRSPQIGDRISVELAGREGPAALMGTLLDFDSDNNVIVISNVHGWNPGTKVAINGNHVLFVVWGGDVPDA